eukprot:5433144-Prymnesium_polylepis.1
MPSPRQAPLRSAGARARSDARAAAPADQRAQAHDGEAGARRRGGRQHQPLVQGRRAALARESGASQDARGPRHARGAPLACARGGGGGGGGDRGGSGGGGARAGGAECADRRPPGRAPAAHRRPAAHRGSTRLCIGRVCRGWRDAARAGNIFARRQLCCFHSKERYGAPGVVLGVGLRLELHRSGELKEVATPFDLVSEAAFTRDRARLSVWKEAVRATPPSKLTPLAPFHPLPATRHRPPPLCLRAAAPAARDEAGLRRGSQDDPPPRPALGRDELDGRAPLHDARRERRRRAAAARERGRARRLLWLPPPAAQLRRAVGRRPRRGGPPRARCPGRRARAAQGADGRSGPAARRAHAEQQGLGHHVLRLPPRDARTQRAVGAAEEALPRRAVRRPRAAH